MTSSVPHLRFPEEDKEAQRGEGTGPKSCRRQEDLQESPGQGGERGGGGGEGRRAWQWMDKSVTVTEL